MESEQQPNKDMVSWSMDLQQLQEISTLLIECDNQFKGRSWEYAMTTLETIKFCFIHSLNETEKRKLEKIEGSVKLHRQADILSRESPKWKDNVNVDDKARVLFDKLIKNYGGRLEHAVKEYRTLIMCLLNKYGYLSKKLDDKTYMGH